MRKEFRFKLLALMTLLAMFASAVVATPAFADGGTPTTSPSITPTTDMSQVPSGTSVVVVDGGGHKVSLGSQKAAEIVATGDPVWCPATLAAPTPGSGGCSPSLANFLNGSPTVGVLAWLTANPQAMNGTIWIESTYKSSTAGDASTITINGNNLTTMANFTLTLQGGWTGTAIDTSAPSIFDVPLQIINWNNNVTINNIEASNTTGNGITITTKSGVNANVTLVGVNAHDNTSGLGVTIDNTGGTGTVTISSSEFDNNQTGGLYVKSNGLITLSNVDANESTAGYGAQVDNSAATTAANVVISGSNTFDLNSTYGLLVNTKGGIMANNLEAVGNGTGSASNGVTFSQSNTGTGTIALTGTNVFNGNTNDGLQITSYGAVTANGLIAYGNTLDGVNIDNHSASTAQPVTLTGSNQFKFNSGNGLNINSLGAIKINNVTAASNSLAGVLVVNSSNPTIKSAVTLTGTNLFIGNMQDGLSINSNALVSLNGLTALGNASSSGNGVTVVNNNTGATAGVTLTGTNYFSGNTGSGLYVRSNGAIAASSLTSNNNLSNGVDLDNCNWNGSKCVGAGNVTLTLYNVFNNNTGIGLTIASNGAITTNNLTASGNHGTAGVSLDNHQATAAPTVVVNGINFFSGNAANGLYITSKGAITTYNLNATGNGTGSSGSGAWLNNTAGIATISVLGTNTFSSNADGGLSVQSKGAVTLNSVTANSNMNSDGANVDNTLGSSSSPQNVTVTGINVFNNNVNGEGLRIRSYGAVTISNVSASGNGTTSLSGHGVLIQNNSGLTTLPRSVTVSGTSNVFSGNYNAGLMIQSYGAISVSNVTSNGPSQIEGVSLDNTFSTTATGVTLTNVSASNNSSTGIAVTSDGVITASGLTATGNTGYGASLDNSTASSAKGVTLSGTNVFSQNTNTGLYIKSLGAVAVAGVQSNLNHSQGVNISTGNSTNASTVTFTGLNIFIGNYADGVYVTAYGAIKTNGFNAIANGINGITGGYGVYLDNDASTLPQSVSVLGTTNLFTGNYSGGLYVSSKGLITANNLTATGNTSASADGAYLTNDYSGASAGVTLTGYNVFNGNGLNGLVVNSRGSITLNNVTANQNVNEGAYLNNQNSPTAGISILGANSFSLNGSLGLDLNTNGAATLNKIYVDGNASSNGAQLTFGTATLTCGSFTNNGQYGLYMLPAAGSSTYKFIGLVFSGNPSGDFLAATGVTQGALPVYSCPLP